MADTEANLLRHFPLLLPQNREKTVYEGFISAQVPCGVILSREILSLAAQPDRDVSSWLARRAQQRPVKQRRSSAHARSLGGDAAGHREGGMARLRLAGAGRGRRSSVGLNQSSPRRCVTTLTILIYTALRVHC